MRIDAPSGSSSWLLGFFSGSFRGELEGLSGSLAELSSSIGNVSSSINTTIYDLSGSFDETIHSISSSISGSTSELSASINQRINNESASFSSSIGQISSSIDTTVHDISSSINTTVYSLSSSFDSTIHSVSASIVTTLHEASASLDSRITRESASISGTIASISNSIDQRITAESSSIHTDIYRLSGSFDSTIHSVSASISGTVAAISNSIDQRITNESASINSTIYSLSGSFNQRDNDISSSVGQISSSINTTITNVSASISGTIAFTSNSIDDRIDLESGSAAEDRRDIRAKYTQLTEFQQYTASADATYYKSGSDAYLNTLIVSGNTLMMGDLVVSGTATHIHTKDVYIKDKFVQIASGSLDPLTANGAGFGIDGANVTMSYDAADDTMHLNKAFTANVTGSLYGTASYAKDVADDGIIARALVELYNMVHITTGSIVESSSIYLNCSSTRTYQTCLIQSQSQINLLLPSTMEDSIEHFILFTNTGSADCAIIPPSGTLVPTQTVSNHIDGGYADSLYPSPTQFVCSKGKGLGVDYIVKANSIIFTHISTYN